MLNNLNMAGDDSDFREEIIGNLADGLGDALLLPAPESCRFHGPVQFRVVIDGHTEHAAAGGLRRRLHGFRSGFH